MISRPFSSCRRIRVAISRRFGRVAVAFRSRIDRNFASFRSITLQILAFRALARTLLSPIIACREELARLFGPPARTLKMMTA